MTDWRQEAQPAMLLRTSYFRQATCFAFVFLLVTLASIVWGQHLLEQVLTNHVKDMITTEIRAHPLLDRQNNAAALAQALQAREAVAPRRERSAAVQDKNGQLLYGNPELLSPALCAQESQPCQGWLRQRQMRPDATVREWLGLAYTLPDGGRYVIGYDILPMLDRIYPIPLAGGISIFIVLLISLGAGLVFSLQAVRRIDRIRHAMAQFALGDSTARISSTDSKDEFDQLGTDINWALGRINHLMDEVRNATNHIAHELRTPLTRLQQRLSNVAEAAGEDRAISLELTQAEDELQRIQQLFRSVMRISEIETGRCRHEISQIDIQTLFADIQDYYGVLAEQRGLSLHSDLTEAGWVMADRALLFQAVLNLLDNAIKYAPPNSTITLLARQHEHTVLLGVADQGPGIAPAQRDLAMQRFQRLTSERSISGHGLGLALVQAVAALHGGQLKLADNPAQQHVKNATHPGLLALIHIPQAADVAADKRTRRQG